MRIIVPRRGSPRRPNPRALAVMSAMRHRRAEVERLGRIRQFVFGTQDGLLTTLGLVTGVSGATTGHSVVLLAGIAEAIAGMVAMASGEFISSRSQAQVYRAEIESERIEVQKDPDGEREEVQALFQEEGLTADDAGHVARLISTSQESWLKTMTEKELGLSAADGSDVIVGSLVMGLAFLIGAAVPILPYAVLGGRAALVVSIVLTLAVLSALGLGKARLARINPWKSAFEVVAVGTIAALIGYLLGTLLPHILHVA
jgi:VIT1/CCC1 family predicted Fe2+/Mn2+ transporter